MTQYVIAALYQFKDSPDFVQNQEPLKQLCLKHHIKGTLLLAREGMNGTIAGSREAIDAVMAHIREQLGFKALEYKESFASEQPFYRMKVSLKKEIVTLGVKDVDPSKEVGEYVEPEQWNDLIQQDDVVLVDTRNTYELAIGKFKNAIDPETENFRDFPDFVKTKLRDKKDKKIAMYCTGGIRCEKSTAYLLKEGFKDVYHLKGGILNYLKKIPQAKSLWEGACFVFDERVSVDHNLAPGKHTQCYGCRYPLSYEETLSRHYVEGVQCDYCFETRTQAQKDSAKERQKQMTLAKEKNILHLGG